MKNNAQAENSIDYSKYLCVGDEDLSALYAIYEHYIDERGEIKNDSPEVRSLFYSIFENVNPLHLRSGRKTYRFGLVFGLVIGYLHGKDYCLKKLNEQSEDK